MKVGGSIMCTAIAKTLNDGRYYFGRNLDFNHPFGESLIIVPRNYEIRLTNFDNIKHHPAIYGVGLIMNDFPMLFDCVNENGLCFAGLNYPGNATFFDKKDGKNNIATFELALYLLSTYNKVKDVKAFLENANITNQMFSKDVAPATLHYIFKDEDDCIVVEQDKDGLHIYDNPYGVLTNNPSFSWHALNISNYMNISNKEGVNRILKDIDVPRFGKAMGALSLPGDSSPVSRFVKATFLLNNVDFFTDDIKNINQCFHILNNVSTLIGESVMDDETREYTIYSSIYDLKNNKLYLKTYENHQLSCLDINKFNLDDTSLLTFSINRQENISNI